MSSNTNVNSEQTNDVVLDLSVKKSHQSTSSKFTFDGHTSMSTKTPLTNKRPLRFQCKSCDYYAPSASLIQNHIYRHTDSTPYACAYCGHRSTTKSTIMVHIELCHPNMEVNIIESRVREQDFYRDLTRTSATTSIDAVEHVPTKRRKARHANRYDCQATSIDDVPIAWKSSIDDSSRCSPMTDGINRSEHADVMILPKVDSLCQQDSSLLSSSSKCSSVAISSGMSDASNSDGQSFVCVVTRQHRPVPLSSLDDSEYLIVYNRPKQYYGSLYEPDKQWVTMFSQSSVRSGSSSTRYICRLCSYTTNHRPSMEDHVFVHTNERPYK
jgi:hypothetical protein